MSYSVIQLTLNASLMGDQWLAVRKTARRLFPGVSLEEREEPAADRLVLDVRTVLGNRQVSASRGAVEIERFEKWLSAEVDLQPAAPVPAGSGPSW